ncbi:MAG: cell division protein FtsL [Deltaproteobacteria bacterium]|nr:cell division protein FtsL [Deltaproteobacteria bacterium]
MAQQPYFMQSGVLRHQPFTRSEVRKGVQRSTFVWWLLGLAVVVAAAGVVHVGVRLQCIKTGYAISHEKQVQKKLREANSALEIRRAELASYKRITKAARERLRMDFPRRDQVFEIGRGLPPAGGGVEADERRRIDFAGASGGNGADVERSVPRQKVAFP